MFLRRILRLHKVLHKTQNLLHNFHSPNDNITLTMLLQYFILLFLALFTARKAILAFLQQKRTFTDQVIVVSGAAAGLGRLLASKLSNAGAILILLDVNEEGLTSVKEQLSGRPVHIYPCDVSDPAMISTVIAQATADVGRPIDVVVNNAGIVKGKPFLDLTPADVERTFKINSMSHFWMNQAVLPQMIAQKKGLIVTMSSVMSLVGSAGLTDYCASKWAVTGLHEALRLELVRLKCDKEIDTLLICPYAVNTGMFKGIFENSPLVKALVPVLEPQAVVDRIFTAMQNGDKSMIGCAGGWHGLVFPWLSLILHALPVPIMDSLIATLGGCNGMDTFKGRD